MCPSPAGCLGLATCYDVRFPEVFQRLVFDMGARVLTVPSAFTKATGAGHGYALQLPSLCSRPGYRAQAAVQCSADQGGKGGSGGWLWPP